MNFFGQSGIVGIVRTDDDTGVLGDGPVQLNEELSVKGEYAPIAPGSRLEYNGIRGPRISEAQFLNRDHIVSKLPEVEHHFQIEIFIGEEEFQDGLFFFVMFVNIAFDLRAVVGVIV